MYKHIPTEFVAEDLLIAALGLQNVCLTSGEGLVPETTSTGELIDDEVGFRIVGGRDEEQGDNLREVTKGSNTRELVEGDVHYETLEYTVLRGHEGTQVDDDGKPNEYVVIESVLITECLVHEVEDSVIIHDQYHQADLDASEGGWSYYQHEPQDEETGDKRPAETWASFRLYLKRAKEARQERVCRIFDWLQRSDAKTINGLWWKFRKRTGEAYRAYRAAGRDTSKLYLTFTQKTALERYKAIRLRQLP